MSSDLKTLVKRRLVELGINPFEAARRGRLERSFVNDLLNGKKRSIRGDNATKLAAALEVDVVSLLSRRDGPPPEDVELVKRFHQASPETQRIVNTILRTGTDG
jgi:transcriptional regulator with XRE-family HTH domain